MLVGDVRTTRDILRQRMRTTHRSGAGTHERAQQQASAAEIVARTALDPSPLNFTSWEEHALDMEIDMRARGQISRPQMRQESSEQLWFSSDAAPEQQNKATATSTWQPGSRHFEFKQRNPRYAVKHRAHNDATNPKRLRPKHSLLHVALNSNSTAVATTKTRILRSTGLTIVCWVPEPNSSVPVQLAVDASSLVSEVIADALRIYFSECEGRQVETSLNREPQAYKLYIAEDDGEADEDLPALDRKQLIGQFSGSRVFALIENRTFGKHVSRHDKRRHSVTGRKIPALFKVWLGMENTNDYCSLLWQGELTVEAVLSTVARKQVVRVSEYGLMYANAPEKGCLPLGATLEQLGSAETTSFRFCTLKEAASLEKKIRRHKSTRSMSIWSLVRTKSQTDLSEVSRRQSLLTELPVPADSPPLSKGGSSTSVNTTVSLPPKFPDEASDSLERKGNAKVKFAAVKNQANRSVSFGSFCKTTTSIDD